MRHSKNVYDGVDSDAGEVMDPNANIVRDAWVFDLIPETQTCAGWTLGAMNDLYNKVSDAWQPYGHMVSNLPPELREKHKRIYDAAIQKARNKGWDPDAMLQNDQ